VNSAASRAPHRPVFGAGFSGDDAQDRQARIALGAPGSHPGGGQWQDRLGFGAGHISGPVQIGSGGGLFVVRQLGCREARVINLIGGAMSINVGVK